MSWLPLSHKLSTPRLCERFIIIQYISEVFFFFKFVAGTPKSEGASTNTFFFIQKKKSEYLVIFKLDLTHKLSSETTARKIGGTLISIPIVGET